MYLVAFQREEWNAHIFAPIQAHAKLETAGLHKQAIMDAPDDVTLHAMCNNQEIVTKYDSAVIREHITITTISARPKHPKWIISADGVLLGAHDEQEAKDMILSIVEKTLQTPWSSHEEVVTPEFTYWRLP